MKSIQLALITWKLLTQLKLDLGKKSYDEVVRYLIEQHGGY